ncbi:hypothetical protein GCM10009827_014280 [Dactylosporangium maewongense]|uniref:Uncharacterized protein n=1 Tax=Dactylosporangium maewongense TaxID=634393 RepID=A0ABN1ZR58_9ACTN
MDLTDAMHAATQDPPPTAIDVDQLITGEHRRVRRMRAVTGLGIAAVLAAGVVVLPQYLAQPTGQSPGAPPSTVTGAPAPCALPSSTVDVPTAEVTKQQNQAKPLVPLTESCGDAQARLSVEFTALLRRLLPGATIVNAEDQPTPLPARFLRVADDEFGGYSSTVLVPGGIVWVRLDASELTPAQYHAHMQEECASPKARCRTLTIGSTELMIRSDVPDGFGIDVWAVRPDGTRLLARARPTKTGEPTPLTEQQLIGIVMTPALTLYP